MPKVKNAEKNGAINDRPLFMQNGAGAHNGNRRFSAVDNVEVSNFRRALPQFIAVSIKNILLFGYGMTLGFPTIVIPAIQGGDGREQSDIVLNKEQISWFSSINLICVPLGCLFSGIITQPLGKRRAMQFVNLPILAAWILFHFATSTEHLYAALCLAGLGGGLMEAPVLTYVAEVTEPKYRGILSALGTTCVICGVFSQFILGSLMDWRSVAACSAAFPVIAIIALCFVPESPVWLIRENRLHEAVKSLQWLRGWVPEYKIEAEFNRLYDELITQPALVEAAENNGVLAPKTCLNRFHMFRKRSFLVPFMLVSFCFFTGHFSGKTPLQTYAVQIFHTLKAPMNKYHATILLGVAELLSTILGVILIHFTGKRPLVLISTVGTGLCFFGTATYAHYLNDLPGFAVNNVVINASAIVPKENIISQANITKIFEEEQKQLQNMEPATTMNYEDDSETTTTTVGLLTPEVNGDEASNRTKRESQLDFIALDYTDSNDTNTAGNAADDATTTQFELLDSNEPAPEAATTIAPNPVVEVSSELIVPAAAATPADTSLPNKVVNELLLPVPKQEQNYLVWLPLILLLLSAFFSHLGIRMIPWILIGEVFPADIRNTASGFSGGLGYVFGFLANKLFLVMLSALTLPGTFWFYSFVAFFGTVVLYFTLPETENRTLGEIEAHFSKKSKFNLFTAPKNINDDDDELGVATTEKSTTPATVLQLNNLQNLFVPVTTTALESKIIHLQQSDFTPQTASQQQNRRTVQNGETNLAYEEHNTTHL